ncbi:MAG: NfeD family protein [Prolixibacteraceae bacterium]
MEFEIWHIWLIVAILFFILEIFIPSFVVFNFGVGSLFASLGAVVGLNVQWQVLIFSIFTLSSFFLVRPALKKWAYKKSHQVKTNFEALEGRIGIVSEKIDFTKNSGRVKLDGDYWMARSKDGSTIDVDSAVKVLKLNSIVLEVEKL